MAFQGWWVDRTLPLTPSSSRRAKDTISEGTWIYKIMWMRIQESQTTWDERFDVKRVPLKPPSSCCTFILWSESSSVEQWENGHHSMKMTWYIKNIYNKTGNKINVSHYISLIRWKPKLKTISTNTWNSIYLSVALVSF